jgi:peptidoglycan/xylan/chitin deacetylase (PgdA/CDA1 family)
MLFELADASNDAVARGWCHLVGKVPGDVVRAAIQQNTRWLRSNGMPRAAAHFAFPWGEVDDDVIDILKQEGFRTARLASPGPLRSQVLALRGAASPYLLPHYYLDNATTAMAALSAVDEAVGNRASLIFLIHRLVPAPSGSYEFATAEFRSLIEGLRQRRDRGLIAVPTITEWSSEL